jgi:hypothetical protein
MAASQIDDVLEFDGTKVFAKGPLTKDTGDKMKTFWVRVCQRDHTSGTVTIAEAVRHGDFDPVPNPTLNRGEWALDLDVRQGQLEVKDGSASAVLVFESGDDLFTLAWAECVHLHQRP